MRSLTEIAGKLGVQLKIISAGTYHAWNIWMQDVMEVYGYAGSLMPNMVNSVHMNGHQVIADPRGPQDKGKDLFQEYVAGQLAREHITAHFVDDLPYHKWGGNVHCATNVTYRPHDKAWWR